jgi:hypothetical protein
MSTITITATTGQPPSNSKKGFGYQTNQTIAKKVEIMNTLNPMCIKKAVILDFVNRVMFVSLL